MVRLRFQEHASIEEDLSNALKKAAPSLLASICIGFLLIFVTLINKNYSNNGYNELIITIQESLALNSIYLLFFLVFLSWGTYLILLSIRPSIYYVSRRKNVILGRMLRISSLFVNFSSVSLGVILSARIYIRILPLFNIKLIKEIIEIGNLKHAIIIIFMWLLVFVPYHHILKPIAEPKKRSGFSSNFYFRPLLHKSKNRCILLFFGVFIVCISTMALWFALLH
jgi:hypothetical protein